MPPIGRENTVDKHVPTNEEIEQSKILDAKKTLLRDSMLGIRLRTPAKTSRFKFPGYERSAVVVYPLDGEPEHVKMKAWIERSPYDSGVLLKTEMVTILSGEPPLSLGKPRDEAETYHGKLCRWQAGTDERYFENADQRLRDLQDTVDLIVEANAELLGLQVGRTAIAADQ
jgi:hypothetical protein